MKFLSLAELVKSRMFLPGILFLAINLNASYLFYQVNSYKIFLVFLAVLILFIRHDTFFPSKKNDEAPWKMWLLLSLPILASFPGYLLHGGVYNYNFRYELATFLVLLLWAVYLYRGVSDYKELSSFFLFIGITLIYVSIWAILERIGYHPLAWDTLPVARVKATFGNINYFSGFLVVILPITLSLAIPDFGKKGDRKITFSRWNGFFLFVFLLGELSLILAQTRAAMAANIASLFIFLSLITILFVPSKWKKWLVGTLIVTVLAGICAGVVLFIYAEEMEGSRIASLFTKQAWLNRLIPWGAAIASIKASPFTGYGLGSSYTLFFEFVETNARLFHNEHSYNHAHSEILEYLQETGLIGGIAFVVMWGTLFYMLYKIIRAATTDRLMAKLAIGIGVGFLAFHIHGSFSVAPRMIVMKVPLFTLFAITFILYRQVQGIKPVQSKRIFLILPSVSFLVITVAFLLPWFWGQYQFVSAQEHRSAMIRADKLKELTESFPDAYALDYLSHLQVQLRQPEALKKTIEKIDRVLPEYRELGYTRAMHAAMNRNLPEAIRLAKIYQERDRYYSPGIELLLFLAVDTNNKELFFEQFSLFVRKIVYEVNLVELLPPESVPMRKVEIPQSFTIKEGPNHQGMQFEWNVKFIDHIFQVIKNGRSKKWKPEERQAFWQSMVRVVSSHPYFRIKIHEEWKAKETPQIMKILQEYFKTKQEKEVKQREISQRHNTLLRRTRGEVPHLQKVQSKEMQKALKPFNDSMEKNVEYLEGKTDWKRFLQKQGFANAFISGLVKLAFQNQR